MNTKDIKNIIYESEWPITLLHYFISGATQGVNKGINTELTYLLLPMLSSVELVSLLSTLTKSSSLKSIDKPEQRKLIIELPKLIKGLREVSNKSLSQLGSKVEITPEGLLKATSPIHYSNCPNSAPLRPYLKSAYILGIILSKDTPINILTRLHLT